MNEDILTARWETKQLDVLHGHRPISRVWLTTYTMGYPATVIWESNWVLDVKLNSHPDWLSNQLTLAVDSYKGRITWP